MEIRKAHWRTASGNRALGRTDEEATRADHHDTGPGDQLGKGTIEKVMAKSDASLV